MFASPEKLSKSAYAKIPQQWQYFLLYLLYRQSSAAERVQRQALTEKVKHTLNTKTFKIFLNEESIITESVYDCDATADADVKQKRAKIRQDMKMLQDWYDQVPVV